MRRSNILVQSNVGPVILSICPLAIWPIQLAGAACVFVQDVVDILKSLLKHALNLIDWG